MSQSLVWQASPPVIWALPRVRKTGETPAPQPGMPALEFSSAGGLGVFEPKREQRKPPAVKKAQRLEHS